MTLSEKFPFADDPDFQALPSRLQRLVKLLQEHPNGFSLAEITLMIGAKNAQSTLASLSQLRYYVAISKPSDFGENTLNHQFHIMPAEREPNVRKAGRFNPRPAKDPQSDARLSPRKAAGLHSHEGPRDSYQKPLGKAHCPFCLEISRHSGTCPSLTTQRKAPR